MMICMLARAFLISPTHWMPDMPGSLMSINTTSGFFSNTCGNASSADAKVPRHSMSGAFFWISPSFSRHPRSSSTTMTVFRIRLRFSSLKLIWLCAQQLCAFHRRLQCQPEIYLCVFPGLAFHLAGSANLFQAPLHVRQSVAGSLIIGVKAAAIVLHHDG